MQRVDKSRSKRPDLLGRPPSAAPELQPAWALLAVDPLAQVARLADLWQRGLLSPEEYEQQRARILEL
jgi:alkanesulfonate monooxygenase SsuD/methylene tetrahydromethanopterin reductase-like flavin-dependent oxidoreductase (luciferase family)